MCHGNINMNNEHLPWISKWMLRTQKEVLDKFSGITNAYTDGEGDNRFVYIPGKRNDRVLLVAHADTVIPTKHQVKLSYKKGILYSERSNREKAHDHTHNMCSWQKKGFGIGADDRAGCGILWKFRNLGHSLLITSGEEQGCKGTKWLMEDEWWRNELNTTHCFAVQFDRRNAKDAVFYDISTNKFVECVKNKTGFTPTESHGRTDISFLCKLICGVNLSVGYYDEHTRDERLSIPQFENTLNTCHKWLSETKIELFEQDPQDRFHIPYNYSSWNQNNPSQASVNYKKTATISAPSKETTEEKKERLEKNVPDKYKKYKIKCPLCQTSMFQESWYSNEMRCIYCDKEIPTQ